MGLHNSKPTSVIQTFYPKEYTGKWYQVMGNKDKTNDENVFTYSENITFKDGQIDVDMEKCGSERCQHTHGKLFQHDGYENRLPGSLVLNSSGEDFDYNILWTDYKNYAIILIPQTNDLRVMGRKKELNTNNIKILAGILKDHSINLDDIFCYC